MNTFAEYSSVERAYLLVFLLVILILQLGLLLLTFRKRRQFIRYTANILLFVVTLVTETALNAEHAGLPGSEQGFFVFGLPYWVLWVYAALLFGYTAFFIVSEIVMTNRVLSRRSIKEGLDALPCGVCIFDRNGIPLMCNRTMHRLFHELCGKDLQWLTETVQELEAHTVSSGEERVAELPDGTIRRFSEQTIRDASGRIYTQITAYDATELHKKQQQLAEDNQKLGVMQQRIRRLYESVQDTVREEETLAMKMRVHDDIGRSVIAAHQCLAQEQPLAQIKQNISLWEDAIGYLRHVNETPEMTDEYGMVCMSAADIGVEIRTDGILPPVGTARHLIADALRECVTNCVRHAAGSVIFVSVKTKDKTVTARFTNTGRVPEEDITEGGGLSALRQMIEKHGGTMTVQSKPHFMLTVLLPEETEEPL